MNQVCLEPPTPMAFSRCSSLTSLNSFDVKSVHSSVNSEYSMIVSKKNDELASPGGEADEEEEEDELDKLMPDSPAAANNSFKTAQRIMHKQQQLQYRQSAILAMSGGDLKSLLIDRADENEPANTKSAQFVVTLHTPPVKLMPQVGKFGAAPTSFTSTGIGSFGMAPGGSFAQPVQFNFQNPQPAANRSMPSAAAAVATKPFAFLKNSQSQFNGVPPLPPPKFLSSNRQLNMAEGKMFVPAPPNSVPPWQLPLMPSTSVSSSLDSEDVPVVYGQCRTPRFKPNAAESVSSSHQNSPPESVCSHSSVPSVIREDLNSKNQQFNAYLNILNAKESLFPRANRDKSQHYFMLNTPSSTASSCHFNDTLVVGCTGELPAKTTGLKLIDQHDANHLERHCMRDKMAASEEAACTPDAVPLKEEDQSERPSFLGDDDDEQPRTFLTEETPNQSILNEPKSKALIVAQNQTINRDGTVTEFSSYFSQMSLNQPRQTTTTTTTVFPNLDSQYRFNQKQVPYNFVERSSHLEHQIGQQAVKMPYRDGQLSESWSFQNFSAAAQPPAFTYKNAPATGLSNLEEQQQQQPDEFDRSKEDPETSIMREHGDADDRPFDVSDDDLILQNFIDEMLPHVIGNYSGPKRQAAESALLVSSPAYCGKTNTSLNDYEAAAAAASLIPNNTPNMKISTINLAGKPPLIVKRASLNIKQHHHHHLEAVPWAGPGIKFPKRNSNGSTHELAQSISANTLHRDETKAADRTNRPANPLNLSNLSTNSVGSYGNKGSGASSIENSCKLAAKASEAHRPQFKKRLSAEGFDLKPSRQNLSPSVGRKMTSKFSSSKLNKPSAIASSTSSNGLNTTANRPAASNNLKQAITSAASKPSSAVAADRMNTTISTHPVITMTKTAQLRANANQLKKPAASAPKALRPKPVSTTARAAGKADLNETHSFEPKKLTAEAASNARRKSLVLEKPASATGKPKTLTTAANRSAGVKPTPTGVSRPAFKAK